MGKGTQIKRCSLEVTDWKQKCIIRGIEAKSKNKRNRELVTSRDLWKAKYTKVRMQCDDYENELNKIKKKLNEILS